MPRIEEANLPQFESGARVGRNGRYTILFLLFSTRSDPYVAESTRYIVKDSEDATYKVLIAFVESPYRVRSYEFPQSIASAIGNKGSSSYVFQPSDTFQDSETWYAIHELHGPYLYIVSTEAYNSASWVRKIFRETLESLEYAHSKNVVCGYVDGMNFIFTYPQLKSASEVDVKDFYWPADSTFSGVVFNEYGCAATERELNLDFRVKLQNLREAIVYAENSEDNNVETELHCPPPELQLSNEVGYKLDIWYLGIMMADLIGGSPDFVTFVGGRGSKNERASQMRQCERLLGPLPSKYQSLVTDEPRLSRSENDKEWTTTTFFEEICDYRSLMVKLPYAKDYHAEVKEDNFCERSMKLVSELLMKMLAYDPAERFSASEALQHEFFSMESSR